MSYCPIAIYKWVLANLMPLRWSSVPSRGGVEIPLVALCHRNWATLRSNGPLSSYANFTYFTQGSVPTASLIACLFFSVYGTFSFSFEIFLEANRQNKRDLNILVVPTTPLFFRVRVISPDSDLVLHLSRCWARNSDGVGPPAFIEEG